MLQPSAASFRIKYVYFIAAIKKVSHAIFRAIFACESRKCPEHSFRRSGFQGFEYGNVPNTGPESTTLRVTAICLSQFVVGVLLCFVDFL